MQELEESDGVQEMGFGGDLGDGGFIGRSRGKGSGREAEIEGVRWRLGAEGNEREPESGGIGEVAGRSRCEGFGGEPGTRGGASNFCCETEPTAENFKIIGRGKDVQGMPLDAIDNQKCMEKDVKGRKKA